MSETVCDRLLRDLRMAKERHINGTSDSLTWIMERRMIIREAEFQGVTDKLIERIHNEQLVRLNSYGDVKEASDE